MIYSEYPVYSPYFCASGVGFFLEAILRHGGSEPNVVETKCQTLGDTTCTFEMTWR
jgi:predicted hydrocarbon binding protein